MGPVDQKIHLSYNTVMDELLQRSQDFRRKLNSLDLRSRYRRDLVTMLDAADARITELSQEAVNCRRLRRQTRRYEEIYQLAQQALDNVDQHLLVALLTR